jgi:ABC-type branched-subunit amino acid transport system permease subunit
MDAWLIDPPCRAARVLLFCLLGRLTAPTGVTTLESGTTLKAVAQSHVVASSVGINEAFYRILAVGVGCFFVGLSGAFYAHYNLIIGPDSFNLAATLWFVMYVLVGGINSFAGPIIGALVLFLLPEVFRDLKMYTPYISAGILLIVVYLAPQGIAGLPRLISSKYGKR